MSAIDDDNANYGYVPGLEAKTAKFNDPDLSDQQIIDLAFQLLMFCVFSRLENGRLIRQVD